MKFGLDSFVYGNFFSIILSIFLLLGIYILGKFLIFFFNIKKIIYNVDKNISFQENIIGLNFLLIIIYPLVQYSLLPVFLITLLAYLLILFGAFYFYLLIKKINFLIFLKKKNIYFYYIFFFIFGYFLLSLGPTTNADSLDYHLFGPLHYLNFQSFPNQYSYFHGKLIGSGEVFNLIGLSIGAEQFSSLIQYSCLVSIMSLIVSLYNKGSPSIRNNNYFLILCILSSPVLLFFLTSSKLEFLPVAANAFCFTLVFFCFDNFKKKDYLNCFVLVNLLLIAQTEVKHSFILSSLLIWLFFLYKVIYKNLYFNFIFITTVCFVLVLFTNIFWKITYYQVNIIELLRFNLPINYPGYLSFYNSLTSCGYYCWPTWIFFPKNISEFSNSLGLASLFFFIIVKHLKIIDFRYLTIIILLFFSLGLIFGPSFARFYIDPFIWLVLSVSYYYREVSNDKLFIYFKKIIIFFSIPIFLIVYFGVFTNSFGSISKSLRETSMHYNANGYDLFKWAQVQLPKDARVLSLHRSVSLSPVRTYPADFLDYVNPDHQQFKIYLNEIKKEKINFILFTDNEKDNSKKKIFSNCLGKLYGYKKDISFIATRNPFNRGQEKHNAYIYEFKYYLLPLCVLKQKFN